MYNIISFIQNLFKALSLQSSFFDRLFNGDFKEKNMEEISIGDVEYEVRDHLISNLIKNYFL